MLETRGLSKVFGGLKAVDNVSIKVKSGSLTLLMGPNGSGKTTLVNTITGVYKADSGEVYFDGKRITGLSPHRIYELGLVRTFQTPALFPKMTVLENLLVAARRNPGENPFHALFRKSKWLKREEELVRKAFEILDFVELRAKWDSYAYQLSGGQMKLLEMARALMADPRMLIMDEPIAGVLPRLAHKILELLVDLKKERKLTFLVIEHRLDIMLNYADEVYVMHNGRIVYSGDPSGVTKNKEVVEAYLGAE